MSKSSLIEKLPESLRHTLEFSNGSKFWSAVERYGTPFIEPVPGSDHYRATFVVKGDAETTSIVGTGGGFNWVETRFDRIPDTDIWLTQFEIEPGQIGSYVFLRNLPPGTDYWAQRNFAIGDPFNKNVLNWSAWPKGTGVPYSTFVYNAPGAIPGLFLEEPPVDAIGKRAILTFESQTLRNSRDVHTYLPKGHLPGESLPLLIVFDGTSYFGGMSVPRILDNMIARGVIPPLAAIGPCSIDTPTRNRELPCNREFFDMLTEELLPFVQRELAIDWHGKPVVLAGSSYGGLAALYGGVIRGDLFTHVLSQAGAVYWSPEEDFSKGHSWLPKEIERTGKLPSKVYFDAGTRDNVFTSDGKHPAILEANRALVEQFTRQRFEHFKYLEYCGGHDYACWQRSFPVGLEWLLNKA